MYGKIPALMDSERVRVTAELNEAVHTINEHNKDLVRKYRKEMSLRKKYHNELVVLKGTTGHAM